MILVAIAVLAANPVKPLRWAAVYDKWFIHVILPEFILHLNFVCLLFGERIRVSKRREAHEREGQSSRQ